MIKSILIGIILIGLTIYSYGQKIIVKKFSYSSCLNTLSDRHSSIDYQRGDDNTTIIQLRTYAPCGGEFKGGVKLLTAIQVNLTFTLKPTLIKNKNGQVEYMLEVAECNCLYDFTYHISGIEDIASKEVLINKQSLKQIDQCNILSEEVIELDKEIKDN